jgi:hypothetical protein
MTKQRRSEVPFTEEQIQNIIKYQSLGYYHPLTCGNDSSILYPTIEGLRCPNCNYIQKWVPFGIANTRHQDIDWVEHLLKNKNT